MKVIVNSYAEITPTFFGLVEFEEHEDGVFGKYVLFEGGLLFIKENGEWKMKYKIHLSGNGTIYFESTNRDLLIGKMHPEGFKILKIQDYFDDDDKKPPLLVLEVFEEMIQEISNSENLQRLLQSLNINLN